MAKTHMQPSLEVRAAILQSLVNRARSIDNLVTTSVLLSERPKVMSCGVVISWRSTHPALSLRPTILSVSCESNIAGQMTTLSQFHVTEIAGSDWLSREVS
jgi:hypothetical protein